MSARGWQAWLVSLVLAGCSNGVGEVCAENQPCAPALRCVFPSTSEEASLGVCDYPLRQFGDRCSRGDECEGDLTCSSHFTPGEHYGTCIHRLEAGAGCFSERDCLSGICTPVSDRPMPGVCGQ